MKVVVEVTAGRQRWSWKISVTSNSTLALNYTYMVQIQSQRRIHTGGERGASPPTAVVRRKFRHYRDSLRKE